MKSSPYITWAKSRYQIRYNLARSGVPTCKLENLFGPLTVSLKTKLYREEGWPPLLERLHQRYSVPINCIVLAHGASMANHLACAAVLEPGDDVLVEHPTYDPLLVVPRFFHAQTRPFTRLPQADYAVDVDQLRDALRPNTKLVILSNLHNPTGALLDEETLDALTTLAEEHGFYLLLDEVYLEFLHDAGFGTGFRGSPQVIATRSLTKAYGLDGLRAGWLFAAPALAERIRRLNDLYSITTAFPSEQLAALALAHAPELLAPTQALLNMNRRLLAQFVAAHPCLSWTPPDGGTVALVSLKTDQPNAVKRLVDRLEADFETTIAPGHFFGVPDGFRVGVGMETATLKTGLRRLAEALALL